MLLRPILFLLMLMVGAALLFRVLRPIKRKLEAPDTSYAPGLCPRCGYQASVAVATSPMCPECGTVRLSEPQPRPPTRPPTSPDASPAATAGPTQRPVKKVQNQAEQ